MEYPTFIVLKTGLNKILTATENQHMDQCVCPLAEDMCVFFMAILEHHALPHYYCHPLCGVS